MRWINEIGGKVVCLLLHSSEYCRQLIYDKLCTLKHGHSHFKRAQIPKSERVRENHPRRSRRPWPTFAWEEMSHHPRGKWFSRALGAYSRTSTNGRISTTATSLHWPLFFIPAESPYIDSWLSFSTTETATKGDVNRDALRRRFLVQYNVATLSRHCFEYYKVDPTLQRCVALKIIVANRPM